MRRGPGKFVNRSGYVLGVVAMFALVAPTYAQLNTQHLKGSVGLKSASLPPPGGYIAAPVLYFYSTDDVRDREGTRLPLTAELDVSMFGVGYLHVTNKKVLGGNYAFQVLFPLGANNRIQGTEIDSNPGAGLTDSVVAPIVLGWHSKRADALANYTIYMPTGRYTDGASDNTGFGMWGHEVNFGTDRVSERGEAVSRRDHGELDLLDNEGRQQHAARLGDPPGGWRRWRLSQGRPDRRVVLLRGIQAD